LRLSAQGPFFIWHSYILRFNILFNKPFAFYRRNHRKNSKTGTVQKIMGLAINFIGFQIGWFACVIGAAKGQPLLAVICAFLIVAIHLYRNRSYAELLIIVVAMLIGFVWESLLVASGWLSYINTAGSERFAPVWLVAMWAVFATTINLSMAWLKGHWFLAATMGAVFGPLAFVAGEKLGAVEFVSQPMALIALALGWALLMPLLLRLADQFQNCLKPLET
jgi:hypothetical protein